ncbi:hypothetical protein BDR26DRAFT_922162 [Obelidium mucronatum]|nr:hypothetical protein BDR26DRAFT_922162 [Obelidium mucronatum]
MTTHPFPNQCLSQNNRLQSCDECRLRNRKCSREKPICGRCVKLGIDCVYTKNSTRSKAYRELKRKTLLKDESDRRDSNSAAPPAVDQSEAALDTPLPPRRRRADVTQSAKAGATHTEFDSAQAQRRLRSTTTTTTTSCASPGAQKSEANEAGSQSQVAPFQWPQNMQNIVLSSPLPPVSPFIPQQPQLLNSPFIFNSHQLNTGNGLVGTPLLTQQDGQFIDLQRYQPFSPYHAIGMTPIQSSTPITPLFNVITPLPSTPIQFNTPAAFSFNLPTHQPSLQFASYAPPMTHPVFMNQQSKAFRQTQQQPLQTQFQPPQQLLEFERQLQTVSQQAVSQHPLLKPPEPMLLQSVNQEQSQPLQPQPQQQQQQTFGLQSNNTQFLSTENEWLTQPILGISENSWEFDDLNLSFHS